MKCFVKIALLALLAPTVVASQPGGQVELDGVPVRKITQVYLAKNCALLGTGKQAARLVHAINENGGRVVTLYSRDLKNGEAFAAEYKLDNNVVVTDKLQQAVGNEQIGSVMVSTPDFLHYEHVMLALKLGKHVFLEKPLATEIEQAIEIVTLARQSHLSLAVDYHMRYSLALQHLHDLIKQGYFGEIQSASFIWYLKPEKTDGWRNESNPWWVSSMLGTRVIDQAIWMFADLGRSSVIGHKGTMNNSTFGLNEDSLQLRLFFQNNSNTVVDIDCRLVKEPTQAVPFTIRFKSEKGEFAFNRLIGQGQEITLGDKTISFDYQNPWDQAVEDFFSSVKTGLLSTRATSHREAELNVKVLKGLKRADTWSGNIQNY